MIGTEAMGQDDDGCATNEAIQAAVSAIRREENGGGWIFTGSEGQLRSVKSLTQGPLFTYLLYKWNSTSSSIARGVD